MTKQRCLWQSKIAFKGVFLSGRHLNIKELCCLTRRHVCRRDSRRAADRRAVKF